MNLKLKDFIVIAVVMVLSFPIVYFVMMLASGTARIEIGPPKEKVAEEEKKVEMIKSSFRKDSLAAVYSRTYQALIQERADVQKERTRLQEQQQRIDILQRELETQKAAIEKERKALESLVSKDDSLETKRIRQLSKVYGAMRPAEAAGIIETLDDALAVKVLAGIGDDRQKARILTALSKEKATRISRLMGK